MLSSADFAPLASRRRRVIVLSILAACGAATLATGLATTPGTQSGDPGGLRALDAEALQITSVAPHVVVYSLPTKKHGDSDDKGSSGDSGNESGSGDSSDSSGDSSGTSGSSGESSDSAGSSGDTGSDGSSGASGDSSGTSGDSSGSSGSDAAGSDASGSSGSGGHASVSNTVDGQQVGGAQTYNNHDSSSSSSSGSGSSSGGSSNSPVQVENNSGAGAAALDPRTSSDSGTGGASTSASSPSVASTASAVMLVAVACPASQATGTSCFEVIRDGQAASLPDNTTASLPAASAAPSLTSNAPAGTNSPSSSPSPGSTVSGSTPNLSALESSSGKKIELTGYSFQDNQGGNNAKISCPIIHKTAGGTGTYADPITVASGGKSGGASADGIKCGDKFYLPSVKRYVIVEDTGNTPNKSMPHLDMYVANDPKKSCMNKISGTVTALPHPPPGLPVLSGPIGAGGGSCKLPGGDSGSAGGAQ